MASSAAAAKVPVDGVTLVSIADQLEPLRRKAGWLEACQLTVPPLLVTEWLVEVQDSFASAEGAAGGGGGASAAGFVGGGRYAEALIGRDIGERKLGWRGVPASGVGGGSFPANAGAGGCPRQIPATTTEKAKPAQRLVARTPRALPDRKSTRLNSSHPSISYAVF